MKLILRMFWFCCSTEFGLVQWDVVKLMAPFVALVVGYAAEGTLTKKFLGYFGIVYIPYAILLLLWIARRKYIQRQKATEVETVANSRQTECADLVSYCKKNGFPIPQDQMKSLTSAHNANTASMNQVCTNLSTLENNIKAAATAKEVETEAIKAQTRAIEAQTRATDTKSVPLLPSPPHRTAVLHVAQ